MSFIHEKKFDQHMLSIVNVYIFWEIAPNIEFLKTTFAENVK